jgi:hypothetical protein
MAWWRDPGSRPSDIVRPPKGVNAPGGGYTPPTTPVSNTTPISGTGSPWSGGTVAGYSPTPGGHAYTPPAGWQPQQYTPITGGGYESWYQPENNALWESGFTPMNELAQAQAQQYRDVAQGLGAGLAEFNRWRESQGGRLAGSGQMQWTPLPSNLVRTGTQEEYPLHPGVPKEGGIEVPTLVAQGGLKDVPGWAFHNVAQIPVVGTWWKSLGLAAEPFGQAALKAAQESASELERRIGGAAVGLKAAADWRAQGANLGEQWDAYVKGFDIGRRELGPVVYTTAFEQAAQGAQAIGGPESVATPSDYAAGLATPLLPGTLAPLLEKPAPAAIATVREAQALEKQGVPLTEVSYQAGNPIVEAVGQALIDPLNFLGIGASKRALKARGAALQDYMVKPTALTHAEVDAQLAKTIMEPYKGPMHGLAVKFLGTPPSTKAEMMIEETADAMRYITSTVPESASDGLKAWVNYASPNAEESQAAKAFLDNAGFSTLPESTWGKQTSVVMRKMLTNPAGVVDFAVFDKLAEGETVEKATEKIVNRLVDVTSEYYQVEKAPGGVRSTRWLENNPVKRAQQSVNATLVTAYLGTNPGFPARNLYSNTTLGAVQGFGPFYNPAKAKAWMDAFGFKPVGFSRGIGAADIGKSLAPLTAEAKPGHVLWETIKPVFQRETWTLKAGGPTNVVAQATERAMGYMFGYKGTRRYMEETWRVGRAIERSAEVDAMAAPLRRRLYGMTEMSLGPQEYKHVEDWVKSGELWRGIPDDVARELTNTAPELGDEARRIMATAETPQAAADGLDRAMETYRQFGIEAWADEAPVLHNADPTVGLIEQLRAVEGDAGADAFARHVAGNAADRAMARSMLYGKVTQGIDQAPLALRVQVEEGSRLFQRKLSQIYEQASENIRRGWAREVPWEQVFQRNNALWQEFFTRNDAMWRNAVDVAGEQAKPLLIMQHADNTNIAHAIRTKEYVGRLRAQYLSGTLPYETFRDQAGQAWGQYTRYAVTNCDDGYRWLGGLAEQGPLARLEIVATRRSRAILFQEMEAARAEARATSGRYALNIVNKDRRAVGLPRVASLAELDEQGLELATASFRKRAGRVTRHVRQGAGAAGEQATAAENAQQAVADAADSLTGTTPTRGTLTAEMEPRVQAAMDILKLEIENAPVGPLGLSAEESRRVRQWLARQKARLNQTRAVAGKVGTLTRDAILHNYADKRTADSLLSYGLMFHFWGARTAKTMLVTLANNPALLARYLHYRRALQEINKDQPKWWRDQVGFMMGDTGYFANIEQSINPVNGLVGVNFEDPDRNATAFGKTLEDINNLGIGSVWTPVIWAHALNLAASGDTKAADSWVGYLSSGTRTFKYATALLRDAYPALESVIPPGGITLEPWLWGHDEQGNLTYFQGADKYQRKRIGVATQGLVEAGKITPEEQMDALVKQAGPGWDMAMQEEARLRGPSSMIGFFLGQGFKGRQAWEAEIDKANQEWSDNIRPLKETDREAYDAASDEFFKKYPYMSAVWMAGRDDPRRESSYARNVLARIPPGNQRDAIFAEAGITQDMVSRFYDTDFGGWAPQDIDQFMGGMINLGQTYGIPGALTQETWKDASAKSKAMWAEIDRIDSQFRPDQSGYYAIPADDYDAKERYRKQHPQWMEAADYKMQTVMNDPVLYAYYGSENMLRSALESEVYDEADRRWPGARDAIANYYNIKDAGGKPPKWTPDMEEENAWRKARLAAIDAMEMPETLGGVEAIPPVLRPVTTANVSPTQQALGALGAEPAAPAPAAPVAVPAAAPVVPTAPLPTNIAIWNVQVADASTKYGVPEDVINSVIKLESNGNAWAVGAAGDTGLMQIVPMEGRPTQQQLYDPATNIDWGTNYLSQLIASNGGDVRAALAQYNTGSPDTTTPNAQRYLALYDKAHQELYGTATTGAVAAAPATAMTMPINQPVPGAVAQGGMTYQQLRQQVLSGQGFTPTKLERYTPMRGGTSRAYGYGGGGHQAADVGRAVNRMSKNLRKQLYLYFLSGQPLESGALAELAKLGVPDYTKLKPLFDAGYLNTTTATSSGSSSTPWRSW